MRLGPPEGHLRRISNAPPATAPRPTSNDADQTPLVAGRDEWHISLVRDLSQEGLGIFYADGFAREIARESISKKDGVLGLRKVRPRMIVLEMDKGE